MQFTVLTASVTHLQLIFFFHAGFLELKLYKHIHMSVTVIMPRHVPVSTYFVNLESTFLSENY